ncbi:hypothetical protein GQ600_20944 [Phytophthora cactorum]|nr:hypothetical protein GQ600_20944 [Phytophthora cactorum]
MCSGVIEVVQIKNVRSFARQQIEVMRRVEILKNIVQSGLEAHKWICAEGLPAEYHGLAKPVGDQVINTYPYTHVEGLNEAPDYAYSMLYRVYRAIPPAWVSDASIRCLCDRLMTNYPSCRFAGPKVFTREKSKGLIGNKRAPRSHPYTNDRGGFANSLLPLNLLVLYHGECVGQENQLL